MSSGAYALFIDQQAGGGPAGALQRVVPLPPPEHSGAVKFTTVVLSLAYDNFGVATAPPTIPATVRVLRGSGPVETINVTIEVGRKWFRFMHADDQATSVELHPPAGFPHPQVTAMVEYATVSSLLVASELQVSSPLQRPPPLPDKSLVSSEAFRRSGSFLALAAATGRTGTFVG
jgi:hypothetical protein